MNVGSYWDSLTRGWHDIVHLTDGHTYIILSFALIVDRLGTMGVSVWGSYLDAVNRTGFSDCVCFV